MALARPGVALPGGWATPGNRSMYDPCMSCGEDRHLPAPERCRQPQAHDQERYAEFDEWDARLGSATWFMLGVAVGTLLALLLI